MACDGYNKMLAITFNLKTKFIMIIMPYVYETFQNSYNFSVTSN